MIPSYLHTIAELGAGNAAWYAVARALQWCGWRLCRYQFVAQRVVATGMRRACGNLVMRPVDTLADLPALYPRTREVVAARLRQGGCSIAAWKGDELAGILWYQFGAYQEDEVRARYCLSSPRACWDYDVFIAPRMRLGTAFCRLWEEANRRMHARGVQWTCSRISAFNPASLRAHRRLGAVVLGSATFISRGRWQLMFASRAPYFHFSADGASCPTFVFDTRPLEDGAVECPTT
jgi:hypothetical protein